MIETAEKPAASKPRRKRRWLRILFVPVLLALIFAVQHFRNWTNESLLAAVMADAPKGSAGAPIRTAEWCRPEFRSDLSRHGTASSRFSASAAPTSGPTAGA